MSGDPIPTITEADASGEIAEIYADIRATTGVPVVNLIWRHLAAMPGGLAWAWTRARPIYANGAAEALAAKMLEDLDLPVLSKVPDRVLTALQVPVSERPVITAMFDTYNRGNGLNLIAMSALIAAPGPVADISGGGSIGEAGAVDIPVIPALDTLSQEAVGLVMRLNMLGARAEEPIVASLYRHLGFWPGFLAWMYGELAPMDQDGRLAAAIGQTRELARARAGGLAHMLGEAGPCENEAQARAAITEFADYMISRMVPIGRIVRGAL